MSTACPLLTVHPISRRELLFVVLISLLGLALRFWDLSAIAVEHFDEGVYASNLWFTAEEGYRYPDRHLYAPPLLPSLIEWSLLIFGTAGWLYCLFKNQDDVFVMMPRQERLRPFEIALCCTFAAKCVHVLDLVISQANHDVFFVDWEQPQGTEGEKTRPVG